MEQEEKELLLKDLCARLPYGVKVKHITESAKKIGASYLIDVLNPILYNYILEGNIMAWPYLRPMSSMTEDEKEKLEHLCNMFKVSDDSQDIRHGIHIIDEINGKLFPTSINSAVFDYLDSLYIDYRGLIEMGLALEAPEGMYKNK